MTPPSEASEVVGLSVIMHWLQGQPIITTLLALMVIDFLTGIFVAIIKQKLSSTISWKGMSKKAIALLIVGMGIVIDSLVPGMAFAKLIALFYVATEGISILENAALAGVPFPQFITDTFMKMRETSSAGPSTPGPSVPSVVVVVPNAPNPPNLPNPPNAPNPPNPPNP